MYVISSEIKSQHGIVCNRSVVKAVNVLYVSQFCKFYFANEEKGEKLPYGGIFFLGSTQVTFTIFEHTE